MAIYTSTKQSLITEYRVITALMLRETHTIYGHSKLGYLWVVIQSIFSIAIFWGIREIFGATQPHGMSIAQFLIIGFGLWTIVSGTVTKCLNAVQSNKALLTFPQVTELDVMISRTFVLWFTQIIVSVVLLAIENAIYSDFYIYSLGGIYLSILLAPLLGLGLGLTLSSFAVFIPSIERIVPLALRILFFISGVFFSADTFSPKFAEILLLNPIFQLIEITRASLFYGYPSDNCSFIYISSLTILFLSIGLLLERYVRSRRVV